MRQRLHSNGRARKKARRAWRFGAGFAGLALALVACGKTTREGAELPSSPTLSPADPEPADTGVPNEPGDPIPTPEVPAPEDAGAGAQGGAAGATGAGGAAGSNGLNAEAGAGGEGAEPFVPVVEPQSQVPVLSGDGRYLAFKSSAPLIPGLDKVNALQVYRRDLQTGNIEIASLDQAGVPARAVIGMDSMGISFDGRYLVFSSYRMDADAEDEPSKQLIDVYLRDMTAGTTELVSLGVDGKEGTGSAFGPTLSYDGRKLAFIARPTAATGNEHVFVRDLDRGVTVPVDIGFDGSAANQEAGSAYISGNGRYVAFSSDATNLLAQATPTGRDVFVADLLNATILRESLGANGCDTDQRTCEGPSISADGRYVAFSAFGDGYRFFRRDLQNGTVLPATVAYNGSLVVDNCFDVPPVMSADGRYLAFSSCATNLVPHQVGQGPAVFVRDFVVGATVRVSDDTDAQAADQGALGPSISADGSLVAFARHNSDVDQDVVVRARPLR